MAKIVYMAKDHTEKLSDVKSWTASTTSGQSNMVIDSINVYKGPFKPGVKATIADAMQFKNIGEVAKKANLKFGSNDGTGWSTTCDKTTDNPVKAGECAYWPGHNPDFGSPCLAFVGSYDCTTYDPKGIVYWSMPDEYGVSLHFAIKVWGADEDEPPWPTLALRRGKEKTRPAKAGLSGNQKAAVAGVCGAVCGALAGYAVGKA